MNRRTIEWQSQLSAFKARKALQRIKELSHRRKLELLTLYSIDPKRIKNKP